MPHVVLHLLVAELPTNQTLDSEDGVCEFTTACRLAGKPTRHSLCLMNATTEGVVLAPLEFSMMWEVLPLHDGDARVGCAQVNINNRDLNGCEYCVKKVICMHTRNF